MMLLTISAFLLFSCVSATVFVVSVIVFVSGETGVAFRGTNDI